jgi:hypothetical protein
VVRRSKLIVRRSLFVVRCSTEAPPDA